MAQEETRKGIVTAKRIGILPVWGLCVPNHKEWDMGTEERQNGNWGTMPLDVLIIFALSNAQQLFIWSRSIKVLFSCPQLVLGAVLQQDQIQLPTSSSKQKIESGTALLLLELCLSFYNQKPPIQLQIASLFRNLLWQEKVMIYVNAWVWNSWRGIFPFG